MSLCHINAFHLWNRYICQIHLCSTVSSCCDRVALLSCHIDLMLIDAYWSQHVASMNVGATMDILPIGRLCLGYVSLMFLVHLQELAPDWWPMSSLCIIALLFASSLSFFGSLWCTRLAKDSSSNPLSESPPRLWRGTCVYIYILCIYVYVCVAVIHWIVWHRGNSTGIPETPKNGTSIPIHVS